MFFADCFLLTHPNIYKSLLCPFFLSPKISLCMLVRSFTVTNLMFQWNFIIFYYLQRSFRFSGSTVDFHSMQTHLIFIKVTKKLCRFCFANTSFWRRKKYTHTSNCVSWTISHKVNLKRIVSKAAETAEWLERKSQKEPSGIHWMMQVKKNLNHVYSLYEFSSHFLFYFFIYWLDPAV